MKIYFQFELENSCGSRIIHHKMFQFIGLAIKASTPIFFFQLEAPSFSLRSLSIHELLQGENINRKDLVSF